MNLKASVVFLSLLSTPTLADTVTVTFSGTVAPYVWTGSSYITGNPLAGQPFSTAWTVDACQGCSSGQVTSVLLSIGEEVFPYALGGYMNAFITPARIYLNNTVVPGAVALNSFVDASTPALPADLTTPFTYQTLPADNASYPFHLGGSFWKDGPDGYVQVEQVTLANPTFKHSPAPTMGLNLSLLFSWLKGAK